MSTFLITFKPATENRGRGWPLEKLQRLVKRLHEGEEVVEDWRFHNRKDVSIGDRVFLLRQGKGGPAIIGYGTTAGKPRNIDGNWRVPVQFEALVDPTREVFASKVDLAAIDGEAPEGRILTRIHVARERNRQLVESKRKHVFRKFGRLACEACGFDFSVQYGQRGHGFIECHHTKPVVTLCEGQKTHINDLALVCANCHRMIHKSRPWLSIPEFKALLSQARSAH